MVRRKDVMVAAAACSWPEMVLVDAFLHYGSSGCSLPAWSWRRPVRPAATRAPMPCRRGMRLWEGEHCCGAVRTQECDRLPSSKAAAIGAGRRQHARRYYYYCTAVVACPLPMGRVHYRSCASLILLHHRRRCRSSVQPIHHYLLARFRSVWRSEPSAEKTGSRPALSPGIDEVLCTSCDV